MEHRYALIVGIDNYNDTAHFIPLPFAQADARALYELLVDPERGGWNPEDMIFLSGDVATRDEIESQLRELCLVRARPGDLVLFYFAGNAFLDPATRDGYLALRTTRIDRPVTGLHVPTFVDHYLYDSKANNILTILDIAHEAPNPRTGRITLGTLYDYLDEKMDWDTIQYPGKYGFERGSMVLIEWAEWKTASAPLPVGKGQRVIGVEVTPL